MDVENSNNAIRSLKYVKDELGINPEIIVHDLSPNLIKATSEVYGIEKMAFDPFHVMQSLNRAIDKDLKLFAYEKYGKEKKELLELRDYINSIQKGYTENTDEFPNYIDNMPEINLYNDISKSCFDFSLQILDLIRNNTQNSFEKNLRLEIEELKHNSNLNYVAFALSIEEKLPKKELTKKGYQRIILELLKKLKTLFVEYRNPIGEENKLYNRIRWILYFQPEKMTQKRTEILESFLLSFPVLEKYRNLTLHFGSIYHLPYDKLDDSMVLGIDLNESYGDDLKTCLTTFKRYYQAILKFRELYKKYPNLPKKCRANTEYKNIKINKIFESGYHLKSLKRIGNEIKLQMGGDVRNFIEVI